MSRRYAKTAVLKAIKGTGGVVSMIQRNLGCGSWNTALEYVNKWPETREAFDTECAHITDTARSVLIASIRKGDLQSAKWWLERKARDEFGDNPTTQVSIISGDYGRSEKLRKCDTKTLEQLEAIYDEMDIEASEGKDAQKDT